MLLSHMEKFLSCFATENYGLFLIYYVNNEVKWQSQIGKFADYIYGVWAKYRLQITGKSEVNE